MGLPTAGDVHVNAVLGNVSVAYVQEQSKFVADSVFPNVPVAKQGDRYYVYDRGDFNRDEMQLRAPATESAGSGYRVDNTPNYFADIRSLHKDVPDEVRSNSDTVLRPDEEATRFVTNKALIAREVLWVSKYFAASIWTDDDAGQASGPTGTDVLQWDNDASTPIKDARTRLTNVGERTGFRPNVAVMGRRTFDALIDHPDIVDRVKYGQSGGDTAMVGEADIASLFKIDRVLVMDAVQNTATEGAAASHAFIGGKNILFAYAAASPGLMTPSAGYTFSWTGFLGAQSSGQRIKRFRMDPLNATRIEIDIAFDQKLVSADLGAFILNVVA